MSISEQATRQVRRGTERRLPDFTVRARVGPGVRDWMRVGGAWKGEARDGSELITVVLNALPVSVNNKVTLKLVVPFEPTNGDGHVPEPPADE